MGEVYVLDSSAMETLNSLVTAGHSIFDKLDELNEDESILFCDTVKDECRTLFQGEKIAIWVNPVWRTFRGRGAVAYTDCQEVLAEVEDLLDDDQDESEAQALRTMALAYKWAEHHTVVVVSDEETTLEDRCTVREACDALQMKCMTVAEFLARI
ncbi:magnesium-transporting ATPase (P-type) [Arthrobacter sp. V1I7]|uniref:DUF4411 family protein n=1 Tax=Arthrobacter sp. V1I7 TaxID=3042274 RepID=UPI002781BBBF|nr:DUF4411 family protein [Arthrobacter sp. V1I7]MDQ0823681.1 magnesium-transporting ATPase (P-type) [Arthrobacter sp. V1I7]